MIGGKLRDLRRQQHYSLRGLARRVNLSHTFINDIEHGRSNPSIKSLKRLCDVLNVKPEIFLDEINEDGGDPDAPQA